MCPNFARVSKPSLLYLKLALGFTVHAPFLILCSQTDASLKGKGYTEKKITG